MISAHPHAFIFFLLIVYLRLTRQRMAMSSESATSFAFAQYRLYSTYITSTCCSAYYGTTSGYNDIILCACKLGRFHGMSDLFKTKGNAFVMVPVVVVRGVHLC